MKFNSFTTRPQNILFIVCLCMGPTETRLVRPNNSGPLIHFCHKIIVVFDKLITTTN